MTISMTYKLSTAAYKTTNPLFETAAGITDGYPAKSAVAFVGRRQPLLIKTGSNLEVKAFLFASVFLEKMK